jgi:hypothetical protein
MKPRIAIEAIHHIDNKPNVGSFNVDDASLIGLASEFALQFLSPEWLRRIGRYRVVRCSNSTKNPSVGEDDVAKS